MSRPRFELVLLDLDGTLLGPDRAMRAATIEALTELMARGVRVGFATGRSVVSVRPYVEQLRPNGPLVLLNGGMVWDPARATSVHTRHLGRADALAALEVAAAFDVHVNVYIGDELFIARRTPISEASERKDGVPHVVVGDVRAHVAAAAAEPLKLLMIRDPARGGFDDMIAAIAGRLAAPCTLVNSEPTYLEVLPAGVTKGAALDAVHAHWGVAPAAVMAFGDNLNDLELVERAGHGVAMANAHPRLTAAADATIGGHDTDAIASYLREHTVTGDGFIELVHAG